MVKLHNDKSLPNSDLKFTDCQYTGQIIETISGLRPIYYYDGKLYYFGKYTGIPHQIEHQEILKQHEDTLKLMEYRPDLSVSELDTLVSGNTSYVLLRVAKHTEYLTGYGIGYNWMTYPAMRRFNADYWIFNDIKHALNFATSKTILAPCCKI